MKMTPVGYINRSLISEVVRYTTGRPIAFLLAFPVPFDHGKDHTDG